MKSVRLKFISVSQFSNEQISWNLKKDQNKYVTVF